MREVELTIEVVESLDKVIEKLSALGFKETRQFYMKDYYMLGKNTRLDNDKYEILKKCILLRFTDDGKQDRHMIYKDKTYDKNGLILSQEKIKVEINSISKAKEILERADNICLFVIENHSKVYTKGDIELIIQNVMSAPSGIYIELEATENELLEKDDKLVKLVLKNTLDSLGLEITGDYEIKKALISLERMLKDKSNFI